MVFYLQRIQPFFIYLVLNGAEFYNSSANSQLFCSTLENPQKCSISLLLVPIISAEFMENDSSRHECRRSRRGGTLIPPLSMCGVTATFPGGSVHFMMLEDEMSVRGWQSCRRNAGRCCICCRKKRSYHLCTCTNKQHRVCHANFKCSTKIKRFFF